jgi:hypothetical protein
MLKTLEGFTYVALAEGFCSAIPIAGEEGGAPNDAPPQTVAEVFTASLSLFDEALAAGDQKLAAVGKARALLDLGHFSEAAAAVSGIPTPWNYFIEHSETGADEWNPLYTLQSNGRYSVSQREGSNGMPFRGAGDGLSNTEQDPRLPWWKDPQGGFDAAYPLYVARKYPSRGSDVVLASGVEARLMEAEAALNTGGAWLAILNELRSQVGPLMAAQIDGYATLVPNPYLAPLTDPGSESARVDLLFQERAFWLWGTGHRLGDLRRLVNQYGRTQDQVYPTGAYHKGGSYGIDVVFQIDFDETNNRQYDVSMCDVTRTF